MKKISTLCMLLLCMGTMAFAQAQIHNPKKAQITSRPQLPHHNLPSSSRAIVCDTGLFLDYSLYSEVSAANHTPQALTFNGSIYTSTTGVNLQEITPFADANHAFDYTFAATRFDSLAFADLGTLNTGFYPRAATTVKLDSLGMFVAIWGDTVHANNTMANDSLVFKIYSITGTTQAATPIKTVVFSGYNGLSQFFSGQGFIGYSQIGINQQFTVGQSFAVRMEYLGKDTSSHCMLAYTYADSCGTIVYQGQTLASPAYPNPFLVQDSWAQIGQTGALTQAHSGFGYNIPGVAANCTYVYTQNWVLIPIVTLCTGTAGGPAPTVVTTAATAIASTTATINGTVNANSTSTTTSFEWGLTTGYGNTAAATPGTVTGSTVTAISANLSGLAPATLYHYRAKGVSANGTTNGNDLTFTTLPGGTVCTPDPGVTSGFGPGSSSVPCVNQGTPFSQTYTFVIPASVLGSVPITSVTFNSIGNLPAGLTATFSQNPATYAGGSTGCMVVSGTTNAPCGQYQMLVNVTITTNVVSPSGELSALATQYQIPGFPKNFLRVKSNAGTCPAVNAAQVDTFAADPTCGVAANITATATGSNVDCFNGSNGQAIASASGGSNYSFVWNTGATTLDIYNLTAGTYTVTVTSGTATATASYTVTQPTAVTASAVGTTTTCQTSTGTATATAGGGTPGYTYLWTPSGQTTNPATALGAGNYTVLITDSKGCTATASASVTTPNGPTLSLTSTNVTCFNAANGTATPVVTGGSGTIVYNWSNGTHGTTALNSLAPGSYSLTVIDANQCSFASSVTITQPGAALSIPGNVTNATGGNSNGAINTSPVGGTPGYGYLWNNGLDIQNLTGLAPGTYTVTVTDANACTATASFIVSNTVGIHGIELVNKFNVFPNPSSANVNIQLVLNESTDAKIELLDLTGKSIMTDNMGNTKNYNYTLNTSNIANGVYVVRVTGSKLNVTKQLTIVK